MSLEVSTAAVRLKAGFADDASQDATIETIATEQSAAIAATLIDGAAGPDIDLGVSEIVAAEVLEALSRDGGLRLGDLQIVPADATALRARGEARLAPYRKDAGIVRAAGPR